jgi:hypothetical protein
MYTYTSKQPAKSTGGIILWRKHLNLARFGLRFVTHILVALLDGMRGLVGLMFDVVECAPCCEGLAWMRMARLGLGEVGLEG